MMLLLIRCGDAGGQQAGNAPSTHDRVDLAPVDSIALTNLVRKMYQWHETALSSPGDFPPKIEKETDTLYKGIDWPAHDTLLQQLKASGYFTSAFTDNYQRIAERMDKELKTGTTTWLEGDVSPYNEASPWCNCQDYASDKFWETITLHDIRLNKDSASFTWTWGGDFHYAVGAKKEKGNWKISYLEGFNHTHYP